jgi:hypothetical protein
MQLSLLIAQLCLSCRYSVWYIWMGRSQWPRGLRHRSAAARLLRSWVRIQPGARMFVCCECCVLSGRVPCDALITRPEEFHRVWCVVVCDLEIARMRRPWPALGRSATGIYLNGPLNDQNDVNMFFTVGLPNVHLIILLFKWNYGTRPKIAVSRYWVGRRRLYILWGFGMWSVDKLTNIYSVASESTGILLWLPDVLLSFGFCCFDGCLTL